MRLGRKAEAGPGKLIYHGRKSDFIWEIFQVGSEMTPFCDLISDLISDLYSDPTVGIDVEVAGNAAESPGGKLSCDPSEKWPGSEPRGKDKPMRWRGAALGE